MNLNNRPLPLFAAVPRAVCPVCGHTSYSSTGIHPQCSMQKADAARMRSVKRKKPPRLSADVTELSPWQKICPRCKVVAHIRKQTCTCGYTFPKGHKAVRK